MSLIFFVSSVGDTDLAKATITRLTEKNPSLTIFLVPITSTAIDRTKDIKDPSVILKPLNEITQQSELGKTITESELEKINLFIKEKNIKRAYVGVPSPLDEEIPFYIARSLSIPCTIAYEYMFSAPKNHPFWKYVKDISTKQDCDFVVPLQAAKEELLKINADSTVHIIGHLSIDSALSAVEVSDVTKSSTKETLLVNKEDELIFISGTTQPKEIDNQFLEALLEELSNKKYPNLQIRFGLHPGLKNSDDYLKIILETCKKYPACATQFKIILTPEDEGKLQNSTFSTSLNEFILKVNVKGPEAAQAADEKIGQAVPGRLLNEAALKGKPAYFHDKSSMPYLPKHCFSESINSFFAAKPQLPISRHSLELPDEKTVDLLAKLMTR